MQPGVGRRRRGPGQERPERPEQGPAVPPGSPGVASTGSLGRAARRGEGLAQARPGTPILREGDRTGLLGRRARAVGSGGSTAPRPARGRLRSRATGLVPRGAGRTARPAAASAARRAAPATVAAASAAWRAAPVPAAARGTPGPRTDHSRRGRRASRAGEEAGRAARRPAGSGRRLPGRALRWTRFRPRPRPRRGARFQPSLGSTLTRCGADTRPRPPRAALEPPAFLRRSPRDCLARTRGPLMAATRAALWVAVVAGAGRMARRRALREQRAAERRPA